MRWSPFATLLAGSALLSALVSDVAAAAPHPTVLLTNHGKSLHPIIRVVGTDPVVSVEGKEVRIRQHSLFFAERARHYAEQTAELRQVTLNGLALKAMVNEGDDPERSGTLVGGTLFFEARLTSPSELKNAYIALIIFNDSFLTNEGDQPGTEIVLHSLPFIRAGVETKITFTAPSAGRAARRQFIPLLFAAGGAEIRTGFSANAARYFSRIEQLKLQQAIRDYRAKFPDQDHDAVPFVRVSPAIPAEMTLPSDELRATLTISEAGLVTSVTFAPEGADDVKRALAEALRGWLFLPMLKNGEPIACQVVVPFRF